MAYQIVNWDKFQHYGNRRNPPWIKLYRTILDNLEWGALSGEAAKLLVECWLVASEHDDGLIDLSLDGLAWRLRRDPAELEHTINEVLAAGFMVQVGPGSGAIAQGDSGMLADRWQDDSPRALARVRVRERVREREREAAHTGVRAPGSEEENPFLPPEEEEKPRKKAKRAQQLPESWKPSEAHGALADELNVDIEYEEVQFRDHAAATGRTLKDWDAGFRTWLRKSVQMNGGRKGRPRTTDRQRYVATPDDAPVRKKR